MIGWRRNNGRVGMARWRRKSPARLALALLLALAQVQSAAAAIVNNAVATAVSPNGPVTSNMASQSVAVAAGAPAMTVIKTGTLNDDDGTPGLSAGDTISYTVTVANAGNVTLTGIGVSDPLVTLAYQSGDADSNSQIDLGETWTYSGSYTLVQIDLDSNGGGDGDIDNTVTVTSAQLPPQTASTAVAITVPAPAMTVTKTGTLNDDDGTPGLSAGDTISYTVTIANAGNVTLTGIGVSDPMVALAYQSGDADTDSQLDLGETWTYSGSYTLVQTDLDSNGGGDGDIDNTVTVTSAQLPPQTASTAVAINASPGLAVTKTVATIKQLFSNIYEIEYVLTATNTGNVALTNLRMTDDLSVAFAPGNVASTPSVTLTGFSGTGGPNPGYNGVGNTEILVGDVQLAAGQSGEIRIIARLAQPGASATNQSFGSSDQIGAPVASDDPTVTPGNSSDVNATVSIFDDSDADGSLDQMESPVTDRDGDGIPNAIDYDPTGYFYCQSDGRIMAGGVITVTNLTLGGSQTGIGTNANITIVRDGSSGQYEFRVSDAGIYRLSYTLPPGGVASTARLPLPLLDVTSLLPANPGVLGSGEFGASGVLADFSAAANPFHLDFEIESGDPEVFNNNIPLELCGTPQLGIAKQVTAGPTVQGDGRSLVTWRIRVTNTGAEAVDEVQVSDNLASVFGATGYQIVSSALATAPPGFAGAADPFFDGNASTAMLTAGGTLAPGQQIDLTLTVLLSAVTGRYVNTALANGRSPLDGSPIAQVSATSGIDLIAAGQTVGLVASKTAGLSTARLGDRVPYTIVFENPQAIDYYGVVLVDQMPPGFTYVPGSATLEGVAREPTISGNELTWPLAEIESGEKVTLRLALTLGAAASGNEFVNYAYARDAGSGATISNIAQATVRRLIEPVFDCADVIGRVFEDRNRDGYFQDGEPGVPGARIATARGLLVTTDANGLFHITCPMIPDSAIGSNFIVKLDERTLPQAWRLTSENPRTVRLTRGKTAKLNFAAAPLRIVTLEIDAGSFERGAMRLTRPALQSVAAMLTRLESEPSLLRITYSAAGEDVLAAGRLDTVRSLIEQAWLSKSRPYPLTVEAQAARR